MDLLTYIFLYLSMYKHPRIFFILGEGRGLLCEKVWEEVLHEGVTSHVARDKGLVAGGPVISYQSSTWRVSCRFHSIPKIASSDVIVILCRGIGWRSLGQNVKQTCSSAPCSLCQGCMRVSLEWLLSWNWYTRLRWTAEAIEAWGHSDANIEIKH